MDSLSTSHVDLLVLGAGWTGSFLLPHLRAQHPDITFAATTRDGRDGTVKWAWDGEQEGPEQYKALPRAKTVLVVFPIKGQGGSKRLVEGYEGAVGQRVRWIQLGSTGIWDGGPTLVASSLSSPGEQAPEFRWTDRHSAYDTTNARAIAEDELLSQHEDTFVLNLAGLWGGSRDPRNWLARIAPTFEALEAKGSLHLIHGEDLARAIVAVHLSPSRCSAKGHENVDSSEKQRRGERYLLTDLHVYDWWDLSLLFSSPSSIAASQPAPSPSPSATPAPGKGGEHTPPRSLWVQQLLHKHSVRALPRTPSELGRAMDSREFWERFGLVPGRALVGK
ncbi:hypothetical protein JCM10213v2_007633 [Rhodosporidiobolus nylandii]